MRQHNASQTSATGSEVRALGGIFSMQEGPNKEVLDWIDSVEEALGYVRPTLPEKPKLVYSTKEPGDDVPPPALPKKPKLANPTGISRKRISSEILPSLYPIYLPYQTQHLILTKTQSLLESCCFDFSVHWLPDVLQRKRWDCPEALELSEWTKIAVNYLPKLPSNCFSPQPQTSTQSIFLSVNKLRHIAVHRRSTTIEGILELLRSSITFANLLNDNARELQLEMLHTDVESKMQSMELSKNFLESRLERERDETARKRRKLDQEEKEAIATASREDKEHVKFIGDLLSKSVEGIFTQREQRILHEASDYGLEDLEGTKRSPLTGDSPGNDECTQETMLQLVHAAETEKDTK